jgi:hypothetical protein
VLQRQLLPHAQRSPQLQRSTRTPAQPQAVFSHRHSFLVWSFMPSLLVRAPVRGCMKKRGPRQRITPTLTWGRRTAARPKAFNAHEKWSTCARQKWTTPVP